MSWTRRGYPSKGEPVEDLPEPPSGPGPGVRGLVSLNPPPPVPVERRPDGTPPPDFDG